MGLTLVDFFCGAGGSSQGAAAVPGVTVRLAANHWDRAIESHAANFPGADHFQGDIHAADVTRLPTGSLFWASPECPQWSAARGRRRDFDKQPDLFGEILPDAAADRSRALMWDVPRYLEAASGRGGPVLAGVVENVIEVRRWIWWADWTASIRDLGYRVRPAEVGRAMAFADDYVVLGTQRERIRQYGNAVTPPVAEVLVSALVEAVTGESIDAPAAGAPTVRQGVPA